MTDTADKLAIIDKIHLYTHAIDRRRWEIMDHLFTEDGEFKFGGIQGPWRDFIGQARAVIDPMTSTHHQIGNILINLDKDIAHVESYLTATHILPSDYPDDRPYPGIGRPYVVTVGGRYIDVFQKQDDDWRIKRRTGLYDWRADSELRDGGLSEGPTDAVGKTDDEDPSTPVTRHWRV
ncbi:MAG: hypothetical protein Hens3KO_20870 [Henriciella sp.]